MPSTYGSLHLHVVFSTHERRRQIANIWKPRLHAWLQSCLRQAQAMPLVVGGIDDHVHLLFGMPPRLALSALIGDVKRASSRWVHREIGMPLFAWQEGYSYFAVGADAIPSVHRYVTNQEEHHRKVSFRDELIRLMEENGVEYDEKYLL
jgi:REP element-mobilizing transposase RayT